jgi:hypothetical protein
MTPTEILRKNKGYILANIGKTGLPSNYSTIFYAQDIKIIKTVKGEWEGIPETTFVCLIPEMADIEHLAWIFRQDAIAVVHLIKGKLVPELVFNPDVKKSYEFSWDLFKY